MVCDLLPAGSLSRLKRSSLIPASQESTQLPSTIQSALPPLFAMLVANYTPLPLCPTVPGMHSSLWMKSSGDCILSIWRRSQGDSRESIKTCIKCDNLNEALYFTPKRNCFYEYHHMCSIFIYSVGIWLDCGCVMCILKAGPAMYQNLVTSKGIQFNTIVKTYACVWCHRKVYQ